MITRTFLPGHRRRRFQILKDVLGDSTDTKTRMLSPNSVRIQRVGGRPGENPLDQVAVTDWLRVLTAEEAALISSRTNILKKDFAIRMEDQKTFPNAAGHLVLKYRAAIVDSASSWCTEAKLLEIYGCT